MIALTSTSDELRLVTSSTADIDVHVTWVDITTTTTTPGRTNTAITTLTTTDIVASPAASTQRVVKTIDVRNKHASIANTITVLHSDGTTTVEMYEVTLSAGDEWHYGS